MNYNISKLVDSNPNLATELKNKCYKVPIRDQCERYYLDKSTGHMYVF